MQNQWKEPLIMPTKMAENTLLLKDQVNEDLLEKISELSILAILMFESSMEALFRHDFNLAESVIEKIGQVHKVEKEAVLCSQNAKVEEIVNLRLLIESVRRTAEYASDISEVLLNLNVESVPSLIFIMFFPKEAEVLCVRDNDTKKHQKLTCSLSFFNEFPKKILEFKNVKRKLPP